MKKVRCAIYTRKSSEEGLEQEFNSLHAQREACVSYIESQKHEGWELLPNHYDDGGISGGTLERDGLKHLMHDVDEGLVDQIVVYKIDRLTRSLADFAKLVDRLDAADASFVSVTQSFNTATSMGRLTLNVLLSFAQFEREVTAERIRDKIAASKKKGLWMGGTVPLGYEPDGRTLRIVHDEAETIRAVYELFHKHHTIRSVCEQAAQRGLQSKKKHGVNKGNFTSLERGQVYHILTNPIYAGKIKHKDKVYLGQHQAIIDPILWDKIQIKLIEGAVRQRGKKHSKTSSLLVGKLLDETGDRLTPSHAKKGSKRYRYYVSNRLIIKSDTTASEVKKQNSKETKLLETGWRLPAKILEEQLAGSIVAHLNTFLARKLLVQADVDIIRSIETKIQNLSKSRSRGDFAPTLQLLEKAIIAAGKISVKLCHAAMAEFLGMAIENLNPEFFAFDNAFQYRKRGVETKLIIGNRILLQPDQVLVDNVAKAHLYFHEIKRGRTFDEVAISHGITKRRLLQVVELAFLSPGIIKAIVIGDQPFGLTSKWLGQNPLPSNWKTQREIISRL